MKLNYLHIISIGLLLPSIASAELLDGQGIDVGDGARLSPSFTLKPFHNDNLTSAASGEIESFGTVAESNLVYEKESNTKRMFADYLISAAAHESSSADDYVDQRFGLGFELFPSSRYYLGIQGEFFDTHDPRGSGAAEGTGAVQANPDEWHHVKLESNFAYGADTAKGRAELDVGYIAKDYDNNRATTAVRDREDTYGSARFYYRVMPKTSLVLEGRVLEVNYDTQAATTTSIDSTTSRILAGVTWESTYKTTGTAQVGYIQKNFDTPARADGDDITWELGIEWRPRSYSTVSLSTARDFQETNGTGNFTKNDSVTASWVHDWLPRLSTLVIFTYAENSFDQAITPRSDDLMTAGVSVNYDIRRWLALGAGYTYDERDSTVSTFDYETNKFEAFATVTF